MEPSQKTLNLDVVWQMHINQPGGYLVDLFLSNQYSPYKEFDNDKHILLIFRSKGLI